MKNDILDENGLTVASANEIREYFVDGLKKIYGDDINLDSNTSDGQMVEIFTQANTDLREMIVDLYNSMSADYVRGQLQDVRFRLNHLFRKGGTYTIVPITIVITQTVSLQGLDADYNDPQATSYAFSDNSGQLYYLIDSVTLEAGTHVLPFRAAKMGFVQPVLGTITNPVTIVKGVKSGINNSAPTSFGVDQETDEDFAIRRQKATEDRSQNSSDAMKSQLLELEGVKDAYVYEHDYENYPNGDDADGIPLHYIWVIIEGGSNADIANVIYANIGGAGTKGDITASVPTSSDQEFFAHFDRSIGVPLYLKFSLQRTIEGVFFDINNIKKYIANNLFYQINELADTSKPTEIAVNAVAANGGGGVVLNMQISTNNSSWVDYIPSASKQNIFTIDEANITIEEIG